MDIGRRRRPPSREYKAREPAVTSSIMSAIRSKNSRAELLLRSALWRRGYRFRIHVGKLFGRPDVVFSRARVAVFVDSDFWHARPLVEGDRAALRATIRGRRREWWVTKLSANAHRDELVTTRLESEGWRVIRVWESDILAAPDLVASRVERILEQAR